MTILKMLLIIPLIGIVSAGLENGEMVTLNPFIDEGRNGDYARLLEHYLDSRRFDREYEIDVFDCMDTTIACQEYLIDYGYDAKIMISKRPYPKSSHCYVVVNTSGNGWIAVETANTNYMDRKMGIIVPLGLSSDNIDYGTGYLIKDRKELFEADDFRDTPVDSYLNFSSKMITNNYLDAAMDLYDGRYNMTQYVKVERMMKKYGIPEYSMVKS
jgi:hypothetical protein